MKDNRLRAPSNDGALLAVPPLAEALGEISRTADRLRAWDHDFQGRGARRLRKQVRREVLARAAAFLKRHGISSPEIPPSGDPNLLPPLIVTGHQPELFHPGVWIKNFAAGSLAAACGGVGLNMIVDNDLPKSATIPVPSLKNDHARVVRVEFDRWMGEWPYEDLEVHDEGLFASFPERVRRVLDGQIADPILDDFWPRAVRRAREIPTVGLRLALARREIEEEWGTANLEVPLSELCQGEGFLWFASHILAQLPRFQEIHNTALADYRQTYGIRSRSHPVADLGTQGDWREAPFWVWRRGEPRRRALLVLQKPRTMLLRISGESDPLVELPLAADRDACCAVERLADLPGRSVRIRTRALTTTLFARHLLGDMFIHGIGGAKYDELGDAIAARFFGIDPPRFLTLSLTQRLGLPERPADADTLHRMDQHRRALIYNPDRFIDEPTAPETRKLIDEKRAWVAKEPGNRGDKIGRFRAIRAINERLLAAVQDQLEALQIMRRKAVEDLHWNRVVRSREFPIVLHSARRLQQVMGGLSPAKDRADLPTAPGVVMDAPAR
ncbi:hypothetical protein OJF2_17700 [Aquisphaera giovannonii]|uniref:Uncharacterized protein n=1 Tax=Aquisphaera giovannonii TaxID=406548 RepID=A0A5B9VYM2_9BACT|nr:hypothetical protein [Aquisphaera giovannonii]QEH33269.1 hypothetical protein OJF2_17700 [Aquisphaera giovannonii]